MAEIHEESFPQGWDADTFDRMLDSGGMTALVARRESGNGDPVGFVLVRSSGEEAEIITVATARSARGRGVGRALMEEAIRRLQHDRVERLVLEVSENNAPALSLYRSLGFRQVGIRKAYYASHARDRAAASASAAQPPAVAPPSALVMQLDLR